jgi:peptidyl-prolyl cis-trans isomerase SurA
MLLASSTLAQTHPAAPESPYGGATVEEIIARVNDQVISSSDYQRALKELDADAREHGATMQQISEGHKDLLRNLIDQQLWLSKAKELGITGETELIKKLDDIRKQYHMDTMEDLEKAAQAQGVSFEDFKANIRNSIITQEVMRQEVGRRIQFTPGEVERFFEEHKQDYVQPESVRLSEILISTGTPAPSSIAPEGVQPGDPAKLAAAKAKADDIEAKLHAGGDFAQLAKSFSDGPTAASGGDLGQFRRGSLAKVLEEKTFALNSGEYTQPIRTKQGYVILDVVQHIHGGVPAFKDVEPQVEEAYYTTRMEPAIRDYLTKMRIDAYIEIKPGYSDTGASAKQTTPVYSAYTPPAPKKKKKVERTRFRANTRTFRQKTPQASAETASAEEPAAAPDKHHKKVKRNKHDKADNAELMKPGKKEKIRFGQAPTKTLPNAASATTENAGALPETPAAPALELENPLEPSAVAPESKTRFSARAKQAKRQKVKKGQRPDKLAPSAPDAAEVADRQTQSAPLGLAGDTASKKKKKATTKGNKTRMSEKSKKEEPKSDVPLATAPQEPAPAPQTPQQPQQ